MLRGLVDPVGESQAIFRAVLEAMARPGRVVDVDTSLETPPALAPASVAVCLALIDFETRLWLDSPARTNDVIGYLRFYCGAPIVEAPEHAEFALVTDERPRHRRPGAPRRGRAGRGVLGRSSVTTTPAFLAAWT